MRTGILQYSMWEFDYDTGLLITSDGDLLSEHGIEVPGSTDEFNISEWPISLCDKTILESKISVFLRSDSEDTKPQFTYQMPISGEDSSENWVNIIAVNTHENGRLVKSILFTPIDDYKSEMNDILLSSNRDSLTDCMNRAALENVVEEMLLDDRPHAFIMFDIDSFKNLNDTFGHAMGDKMLVSIVKSIKKQLSPTDHIGRVGGDEFFICLDKFVSREDTERFARNLCMTVRRGLPNGMILSVSMGVVVAPEDGSSFDELYRKADIAMYNVKNNGGDSVSYFGGGLIDNGENEEYDEWLTPKMAPSKDKSVLIRYFYAPSNTTFQRKNDYILSDTVYDLFDIKESPSLLISIKCSQIMSDNSLDLIVRSIKKLLKDKKRNVSFLQTSIMTKSGIRKWYDIGLIKEPRLKCLYITLTDINEYVVSYNKLEHLMEYDELTGLLTRRNFVKRAEEAVHKNIAQVTNGEYALLFFDITRFKMINDILGLAEGDKLLVYIADTIYKIAKGEFYACRIDSDRFAMFIHASYDEINDFIEHFTTRIERYSDTFEIVCNFGVYVTDGSITSIEMMIDRAVMAQAAIKGSYIEKSNFYAEVLRNQLVSEQEIVGSMASALEQNQFQIYYQAQFNHSNSTLIGAEALVRWVHPEKGIIYPGTFINIFEKNGFITNLDMFVFEGACKFLRKLIDKRIKPVPISVNVSRCDIFRTNFIEQLESIRKKYRISTKLLRLEITETILAGRSLYATEVISQLHKCGYTIEMDDFGTGYSSLTVLKDINMDILKLDLKFVADGTKNERAGTILSSIVRMAKWLELPVIAEGVETQDQADYLKSIGCYYIQGYLYSEPVTEEEFIRLIKNSRSGETSSEMKVTGTIKAKNFWSPDSLETMMFSSYVGAAAILEYCDGKLELLRLNDKFMQTIGSEISEMDLLKRDVDFCFDKENHERYLDACQKAIKNNEETVVETWRDYGGKRGRKICLRSTIKVIGNIGVSWILYAIVQDITDQRKAEAKLKHTDDLLHLGLETADIYMWEYDLDNDVLYPCQRCKDKLKMPKTIIDLAEYNAKNLLLDDKSVNLMEKMHEQLRTGTKQISAFVTLAKDSEKRYLVRYSVKANKVGKDNEDCRALGFAIPFVEDVTLS